MKYCIQYLRNKHRIILKSQNERRLFIEVCEEYYDRSVAFRWARPVVCLKTLERGCIYNLNETRLLIDRGNRKALSFIAEGLFNYNEESNGSENLTIVSSVQGGAQESVVSELEVANVAKRATRNYTIVHCKFNGEELIPPAIEKLVFLFIHLFT